MVFLTCGKASLLVTLGELNVKVGDQGMDIVIALDLQTEGWGEGQVLWLHSVDVHFLEKCKRFLNKEHAHASCPPHLLSLTHMQYMYMSVCLDYAPWFLCMCECMCVKAHRLNHGWRTKPAHSTHAVWESSLESTGGGGTFVCVRASEHGVHVFARIYIEHCLMNMATNLSYHILLPTRLHSGFAVEEGSRCVSALHVDDVVFKKTGGRFSTVGCSSCPSSWAYEFLLPCGVSMTDCDLTPLSFPMIPGQYHIQRLVEGEKKKVSGSFVILACEEWMAVWIKTWWDCWQPGERGE